MEFIMKVLFLADQPQRIKSQINLAIRLSKKNIKITFVIACNIDKSELEKLISEKIKVIHLFNKNVNNLRKDKKKNRALKSIFTKTSIGQIGYVCFLSVRMFKLLRIAKQILEKEMPDVIFTNGDRNGVSLEQAFLKTSKSLNIKSIVPYMAIISNGISIRLNNPDFYINTIFDKLIFNFFKCVRRKVDNKTIVFL